MNKFFKCAMFFTSFIPLWITIIFIDGLNIYKEEAFIKTEIISILCILIIFIVSLIAIYFSMISVREIDYKPYKIEKAIQEKGITSEFLLSYVLPLFAFDFTRWDSVVQFLIYFIILAFLCIRNNNVYANIIFECMGYKFYACELIWVPEPTISQMEGIIISRSNLCANKGNTIDIATMNKPFYIMKDLKG
ncbi:MAG: hypothetical protein KIC67_06925 [Clostridium butyricum]|nr:hypothetical protein [Clostridium butyricum]